MELDDIKKIVRLGVIEIIAEIMGVETEAIDALDNDSLIEGGLIDSVNIVSLVEFFGTQFNIEIEPEDLTIEYWDSINAISKYIQKKLNQQT